MGRRHRNRGRYVSSEKKVCSFCHKEYTESSVLHWKKEHFHQERSEVTERAKEIQRAVPAGQRALKLGDRHQALLEITKAFDALNRIQKILLLGIAAANYQDPSEPVAVEAQPVQVDGEVVGYLGGTSEEQPADVVDVGGEG